MKWLALLLVIPLALSGQNISGSLSGTVEDSSGAAFAGAEIKVSNLETGFVRTAKTNTDGFFSFPDLSPGAYNLFDLVRGSDVLGVVAMDSDITKV